MKIVAKKNARNKYHKNQKTVVTTKTSCLFFKNNNNKTKTASDNTWTKEVNLFLIRKKVRAVVDATGNKSTKKRKKEQSSKILFIFWKQLFSKWLKLLNINWICLNVDIYLLRQQLGPVIIQCTWYDCEN